ncbi:MAG TPA: Gfo/Idh/MocA family oxidoreductase [Firmicutes bacterium]|jgi:predicted dehydrogenase|nr:Gfo/Idh/MocA family oxidoreductase [Bacillota bacterium]HHT43566.1 Gfo/Idh/MocA family oxidoreductase [Bacillota bacterium]
MIEGKEGKARSGVLRFGMVGGASGSFIADVHRKAALFDGQAELVAGCFSSKYERTLATGEKLGLDPERLYRDFDEMAEKEGAREDGIDFVIIATPNYAHYAAAKAFLLQGIHVACDKPLTFEVEEAEELVRIAEEKGLLFCVTYAYSQCPTVKQAQMMVKNGDIGEIQVIMAEYPQGWLATELEKEGNKQAAWRTDPKQAGISNCVGDIGSHIENTISYITGLEIDEICARLDNFGGEGRPLDTNAHILLKYKNGAVGNYWCSQVAIGYDNALAVRIFGTKGTIEWYQEASNYLKVVKAGEPPQLLSRGNGYFYPEAAQMSRIPSGHPEGLYESFANTYLKFTSAILKLQQGLELTEEDLDFPDVKAGLQGVKFIHRCVESSKKGSVWVKFD